MKVFHHRVNTAEQLSEIPSGDGVEIDLRSFNGQIILQHEPFLIGEGFSSWLNVWKGQEIILNIKEEGIETKVLEGLAKYGVQDYFFLDQSFPFMMKILRSGNLNTAARVSDFECVDTALALGTKWVWVDCFTGDWSFLPKAVSLLKEARKKICLVSPELVRLNWENELDALQSILEIQLLQVDAVCTKVKSKWVDR